MKIEVDCMICEHHFLIDEEQEGLVSCPNCGASPESVDWTDLPMRKIVIGDVV